MKNWYRFRNWFLTLLGCELLLLVICFFYARTIILEQLLFFALALFSVLVLSDLLLAWTLILSFGLGVIVLIAGVVFIPNSSVLLLLISFPTLLGILMKVRHYLLKMASKVQDQEDDAKSDYHSMINKQSESVLQSVLIHWSHEDLFFQINPREYNRMLVRIQEIIAQKLSYNDKLYYLSEGNFIILSHDSQISLQEFCLNNIVKDLEALHFHGKNGMQEIQFQLGYLVVDSQNKSKYQNYSDLVSYLKRQLETDIIVEY